MEILELLKTQLVEKLRDPVWLFFVSAVIFITYAFHPSTLDQFPGSTPTMLLLGLFCGIGSLTALTHNIWSLFKGKHAEYQVVKEARKSGELEIARQEALIAKFIKELTKAHDPLLRMYINVGHASSFHYPVRSLREQELLALREVEQAGLLSVGQDGEYYFIKVEPLLHSYLIEWLATSKDMILEGLIAGFENGAVPIIKELKAALKTAGYQKQFALEITRLSSKQKAALWYLNANDHLVVHDVGKNYVSNSYYLVELKQYVYEWLLRDEGVDPYSE